MSKMNLFCFPFAGGFSSVFLKWKEELDNQLQIRPVELAGRGTRTNEPLYKNFKQAVNDVYLNIRDELDCAPYAFFGHSMGSQLAYELYYKIRMNGHRLPSILFLSAQNPPHVPIKKYKHTLCKDELKNELLQMGGTSDSFFNDNKLLEMFIPVLMTDFKIAEEHIYKKRKKLIDSELVILNGKDDEGTDSGEIKEWEAYTNKTCNVYEFDGGHFYLNEQLSDVINIINQHMNLIETKTIYTS
ncbi:thioesterase II family protein [Bacillus cereus group sp. TH152-1LC]|uniref:thioesterase II family protein n=1 Tax=Bacillus cereus group sp. TH152-1LC TaxID=3018060 RepID=UPI0022E8A076|nr:thioesterase domain-containing protein [Bacillus cereus group sp. TH152-1LC]MDA1677507.1 thioesterase domain-containing protein [Bacillus cereus group sp. TH152-1LC]